MLDVKGSYDFYGDFQINEIVDIFESSKVSDKVRHYDLFSVDFGFIGSFSSHREAEKAMLNCRALYKVYSSIDV